MKNPNRRLKPVNPPRNKWTDLWKKNTNKIKPASKPKFFREPFEALFRIQRGIAGHVSFLAACDANIVFTEYLLYEPILRILSQMKYSVECEVPWAGHVAKSKSDPMRIDFVAKKGKLKIALEVKWLRWPDTKKHGYLDIERDTEKLIEELKKKHSNRCFLCIFGRHTQINSFHGKKVQPHIAKYDEALPPLYADLRRTTFGSRIFELRPPLKK